MKILILLSLFSLPVIAESYLIEGMTVQFEKKDGLLLRGCANKCEALNVIGAHRNINLKDIRKDLKFAGAIGSDVCHETYKGKSLLGRESESKNQHAFCLFSDGSMVEINSLTDYLTKNKFVR